MRDQEVKFAWHQTPIDRTVLTDLTKRRNLRPFVDSVVQIGFNALTAGVALHAFKNWSWPLIVLTTFFHCTFYGHYGSSAHHELSHRTVFASSRLNEIFLRIAAFINWNNFVFYRHSHALHHKYTVHKNFDMEVALPLSLSWQSWIWVFTADPVGVYRVIRRTLRWAFRKRREQILVTQWERRIFPETDLAGIQGLRRWSRALLIGHTVLALLFVVTGNWYLIVLVTLGAFIANWLFRLTHSPQHIGMRSDVADWRQSTRSYHGGPIVKFFYWNMQYHVEHHMYAAVPYYNLPRLHKQIEWDLPVEHRDLVATWREIARTVHRQKRDSEYYYSPPLPEGATPYLEPTDRKSRS